MDRRGVCTKTALTNNGGEDSQGRNTKSRRVRMPCAASTTVTGSANL